MTRLLLLGLVALSVAGCGVQGPLYRTDAPKTETPAPEQNEMKRKTRHQTFGDLSEQDQHILPDLLY